MNRLKGISIALVILSVTLTGCTGITNPEKPISPPTPTQTGISQTQEITLLQIYMVTRQEGWAIASEGLFYTQDGGASWSRITPPSVVNLGLSDYFFLNANTAWLLVSQAAEDNAKGLLFQTDTGGKRWTNTEVPFGEGLLFFARTNDRVHGWALKDYGPASGSHPIDMYRTDSNFNWVLVHRGEGPQNPAAPANSLPYAGTKTGLVFLPNEQTGWVTIELREPGEYGLYMTADGGKTWMAQTLPIPPDLKNSVIHMNPPRFFGNHQAKDGVLPVRFHRFRKGSDNVVVFFTTRDSGATWEPSPPFESKGKPLLGAVDAAHWWVLSDSKLYFSSDSGAKWTTVSDLEGAIQVQFVDLTVGWALVESNNRVALLRTTDGGQTWSKIFPN